mmetsp:Transcript_998/g.2248  ORF Transcript_998/g.2248 Transcript_998/m.2248 type:complete len:203 (-) Transcript_998:302-910(-)
MEVRHPVCPARHAAAGARDICGSGGPAIAVFETQVHLARHVVEVVPNAARIAQPSGGDPTSVWSGHHQPCDSFRGLVLALVPAEHHPPRHGGQKPSCRSRLLLLRRLGFHPLGRKQLDHPALRQPALAPHCHALWRDLLRLQRLLQVLSSVQAAARACSESPPWDEPVELPPAECTTQCAPLVEYAASVYPLLHLGPPQQPQ